MKQAVGEEKITESIRDFSSIAKAKPEEGAPSKSTPASQPSFSKGKRTHHLRTRKASESESEEDEKIATKVCRNDYPNLPYLLIFFLQESDAKPEPVVDVPSITSKKEDKKVADAVVSKVETENVDEPKEEPKPRVDRKTLILQKFTKRTVGEAFDEARSRYLERKRLREG